MGKFFLACIAVVIISTITTFAAPLTFEELQNTQSEVEESVNQPETSAPLDYEELEEVHSEVEKSLESSSNSLTYEEIEQNQKERNSPEEKTKPDETQIEQDEPKVIPVKTEKPSSQYLLAFVLILLIIMALGGYYIKKKNDTSKY